MNSSAWVLSIFKKKTPYSPSFRKAFSLVEVIITLIIISILVGVSVPYSSRSLSSLRLDRLKSKLSLFFFQAHQIAFMLNTPIAIQVNNTNHTLSYTCDNKTNTLQIPAPFSLSNNSSTSSPSYLITLFPSGFFSTSSLYIKTPKKAHKVRLPLL